MNQVVINAIPITAIVLLTLQWIKQFSWFKNCWCIYIAPFVGIFYATILAWINLDYATPYTVFLGLVAGVSAVATYSVQRGIILPSGPTETK